MHMHLKTVERSRKRDILPAVCFLQHMGAVHDMIFHDDTASVSAKMNHSQCQD